MGLLAFWVLHVPVRGGDFSDGLPSKAYFNVSAAENGAVFESNRDWLPEPPEFWFEAVGLVGEAVSHAAGEVSPRISVSVLLLSAGNFVRAP